VELFDTHCHIQSSTRRTGEDGEAATRKLWEKAGYPGGDTLIARAVEHDVTGMICVGCSTADSRLAVDFASEHAACWASIGIHPHETQSYFADGQLDEHKSQEFAALAERIKVVAIGECGLDYFYQHSAPADQVPVLRFQIELALKRRLPLIFHVREAFDDFWPIFDSYSSAGTPIRGVLHSFTDSQENLDKAVERGLYIGVNGIATFAKVPKQIEMYKNIPLSHLLLETDSPFLTPIPHRGTICEPYHTRVTAEYLAHTRGESLESLAAATTVNAHKLFNL
jgi:TatD DNase family protein